MRGVRAAILALVAACGGATPAPGRASAGDAVVYVTSNVNDAQVFVDGRFIGPIQLLHGGIALDPGHHRLELRHEDYFSRFAELDVQRAEKRRLALPMAPVLP